MIVRIPWTRYSFKQPHLPTEAWFAIAKRDPGGIRSSDRRALLGGVGDLVDSDKWLLLASLAAFGAMWVLPSPRDAWGWIVPWMVAIWLAVVPWLSLLLSLISYGLFATKRMHYSRRLLTAVRQSNSHTEFVVSATLRGLGSPQAEE